MSNRIPSMKMKIQKMKNLILLKGIDQVLVCVLGGSGKGHWERTRKKLMHKILMPIRATNLQP